MRIYLLVLLTFFGLTAFSQRREAPNKIWGAKIEHSRKGVDSFRQCGVVDTSSEEMIADRLNFRPGLQVNFTFTGNVQHMSHHVDRGTIYGTVTLKNTRSKMNIRGKYSIVGTPVFQVYNEIPKKYEDSTYAHKCTWKVVLENNLPVLIVKGIDKKQFAWVFNITATKVK